MINSSTNIKKLSAILLICSLLYSCNNPAIIKHGDIQYPVNSNVEHENWVENSVIYEVNIRQYTPEGTFGALEEQLPKIQELGVDILWLMPINPIGVKNRKGTLGSYYSISDYLAVNPEYGTIGDLEELVKEAHRLDMKVIIDWVANHTSWDNALITQHPEFYKKDSLNNFVSPYDWTDAVQLNYGNTDLRKYMIDALKFWVNEVNIDGYRCDVAGLVPCDFWEEARVELDKIKPVFMLAENEDKDCLMENAFDMNYGWELHAIMNKMAKGEKNVNDLKKYFARQDSIFDPAIIKMNFITNHDENSWNGTEFERMGDAVKAFAVLTYTIPGMPLIYTGQEVGNNKRLEFFEKDAVEWPETSEWTEFYISLNKLRHENSVFWTGADEQFFKILMVKGKPNLLVFERNNDDENFLIIINFDSFPAKFDLKELGIKSDYLNYFTEETIEPKDNIELEKYGYLILSEEY